DKAAQSCLAAWCLPACRGWRDGGGPQGVIVISDAISQWACVRAVRIPQRGLPVGKPPCARGFWEPVEMRSISGGNRAETQEAMHAGAGEQYADMRGGIMPRGFGHWADRPPGQSGCRRRTWPDG